jgi:hypothetical protein
MSRLFDLYWKIRSYLARKSFLDHFKEEATEEFLKGLIQFLRFSCYLDEYLRRSMKDFDGKIEFRSEDGGIRVLATFDKGRLRGRELKPDEELKPPANATIVFKDAAAVKNFLLPKGGLKGRRDVLRSLLNNEVRLEGNLNYIYRFGFLASHVQLKLAHLFA